MTMIATTPSVGRPSVAIAASDLVLRICNSWRQGQTVRLTSAKCTIGSGPHCTLRLRARGVLPLHCLILRGRAATVVRRWATDTRLNDRSFADAVLSPGDRLSIGSIELEVISVGAAAARPQPAANQPLESAGENDFQAMLDRQALEEEQHRLDELAAHLQQYEASLATEAEQQHAQRADIEARRQAIDQERQRWQAERDEAQRQLDQQRNEQTARLADFEAQQNALAEQRRQWESQHHEETSHVSAEGERLNAQRAELEADRQNLEQQWQAERVEIYRQLDEQRYELTARRADFEAQQNVLAEQRRLWEAQRDANASQAASDLERLNAQRAELDADRQSLEQQRQQWQAEQDETQRQLDEQRSELTARRAEGDAQKDEAQRQLVEQRSELTARLADFEAQKNALAEQRRLWEAQRDANASQAASEGERLSRSGRNSMPIVKVCNSSGNTGRPSKTKSNGSWTSNATS